MASSSDIPMGSLSVVVIESIIEVILLCLAGYVLARIGILNKKIRKQLNHVNVSLFTPSLLFSKVAFFLTPRKIVELWIIPVIFIIVTLISMAVAFGMGVIFKLKRSQRNFAIAAAMFMNSNTLPIALMQSLVGSVDALKRSDDDTTDDMLARSLTYLVVYSTLGMIVRWSYGVRLLATADEEVQAQCAPIPPEVPTLPTGEEILQKAQISDKAEEQPDIDVTPVNSPPYSGRSSLDIQTLRDPDESSPTKGEKAGTKAGDETVSVPVLHDITTHDDNTEKPISPRRSLRRKLPSKERLGQAWTSFNDFMTAPLWAALASFVVACISPVQYFLTDLFPPIKDAIDQAGNCSIPITLVVLGAFFHSPPPPEEELPRHFGKDEKPTLARRLKMKLIKMLKKRSSTDQARHKGENRAVFVSVAARMIVAPAVLIPLLYVWVKTEWQENLKDPVFVVSNVLLITAAPALTLAQMTQKAVGDTFERLLTRTIFWSYCIVTPPSTIVCILLGILIAKVA